MPNARSGVALNPLVESDAADVFKLWADVEATGLTNWTAVSTLDECRNKLDRVLAYYRREPRHFGPYAIRSDGGDFLGIVGADCSASDSLTYELWYFVCRDHWGQGIATAAARELLSDVASSNRAERLKAEAAVENVASWKLLERLGFERLYSRVEHRQNVDQERFVYELRIK